jgi:hypothetical protein
MREHDLHANDTPLMARLLGLAGLIPFFAGGLIGWLPVGLTLKLGVIDIAVTYATLIASFLGGVRWGANLERRDDFVFVLSVIPSLLVLICLFFPTPLALGLLTLIFIALGIIDIFDGRRGVLTGWYGALRLWLTLGASASLASMALWFILNAVDR